MFVKYYLPNFEGRFRFFCEYEELGGCGRTDLGCLKRNVTVNTVT